MLAAETHPEPKTRADRVLMAIDSAFSATDRTIERLVPTRLNPLAQTGAIANAAFLVAAVTGVVLLPWYSVSAHSAYASVEAMAQSPWTAGLLRSLHRLSSDAAVLFAAIHGLRLLAARRIGGPRWIAWVTGILLVATLWFVGWLGYWLVWDQRAQSVALGTAKLLDGLPIFTDPLSRSFLTNEGVNSLFFFMVFFFHMLIPLAMGLMLWLHISHVSRSRFLPNRALAGWLGLSLLAASAFEPATSALAADLLRPAAGFTIDTFFLLPLTLTDRLSGGVLWVIMLGSLLVLGSAPWWLVRKGKARAAIVDTERCNGCTLCYEDCPYDAIQMVPRKDGKHWELQAEVDASKCVGCGICAGSCDPGGIFLPQMPVVDVRKQIEQWVEEAPTHGETPRLAFVCASSAGSSLRIDEATGKCEELPGYRVLAVPCAGWVQRFTIERAMRRGTEGVLIVGCGPTEPHFREGTDWTADRLAAKREPALRLDKVDASRIHFATLDRSRTNELRALAERLRQGPLKGRKEVAERPKGLIAAAAVMLAAACAGILAWGSDRPYASPPLSSQLVVSFKHPGRAGEHCRKVSPEEKAKLPLHMQRDEICERTRGQVRLKVEVDGAVVLERRFEPRGLRADGNSIALEHLPIEPGSHNVRVSIGDSPDPAQWDFADNRTLTIEPGARTVVLFDRVAGFSWKSPQALTAANAPH
jgi:coenzyme F420-reducing hydrogenase delta subunit/Pyruvate/2-oxoacid:ferredoxin oxidoreductase delta subunit